MWTFLLGMAKHIVYCVNIAAVLLMCTLRTSGVCIYVTAHHCLDISSHMQKQNVHQRQLPSEPIILYVQN